MQRRSWVVLVLVLALLAACSSIESGEVPTESLEPWVRVVSTSERTEVAVALLGPGFGQNYVTLVEGDVMTVRVGDEAPVSLAVTSPGTTNARYRAELGPVAPGTELTIALQRNRYADAPATRVVVPPAPTGVAVVGGPVFALDEDVIVTWDPFDDDRVALRLAVTECLDATPDQFEFVRGLSDALLDKDFVGSVGTGGIGFPPVAFECDADVLVGRYTTVVDLDPAFGGVDGRSRTIRFGPEIAVSFRE